MSNLICQKKANKVMGFFGLYSILYIEDDVVVTRRVFDKNSKRKNLQKQKINQNYRSETTISTPVENIIFDVKLTIKNIRTNILVDVRFVDVKIADVKITANRRFRHHGRRCE